MTDLRIRLDLTLSEAVVLMQTINSVLVNEPVAKSDTVLAKLISIRLKLETDSLPPLELLQRNGI